MQLKIVIQSIGWVALFVLGAVLFVLIGEGMSKGKITGKTDEFMSYNANYQYTCFETGTSLNDCHKIVEFRSVSGSIIKPSFNVEALLSSFEIPYIGNSFPIEVCAEMDPIFIPHGAIIALDRKVPGLNNLKEHTLLYLEMTEKTPCQLIAVNQDRLINSTVQQIYLLESVDTPIPHKDTIKLLIGTSITFDDHENASRVKFHIRYVNKSISLILVYLLSFLLSLELCVAIRFFYLRWREKYKKNYKKLKKSTQ